MRIQDVIAGVRDWRKRWRREGATVTGIVVGRRVERGRATFVVLLDMHFLYEGRTHEARTPASEFEDAEQAKRAMANWPIGSYLRLTFPRGEPHAAQVAGRGRG